MVGDFNVWVDVEEDKDAKSLKTLMSAHGLMQAIQEPTHRDGHTLDQVYYNDCQLEINHTVINDNLGLTTDHFPILLEIPTACKKDNTQTIYYRKVKDVDVEKFQQDLAEAFQAMKNSEDANSLLNTMKQHEEWLKNIHHFSQGKLILVNQAG